MVLFEFQRETTRLIMFALSFLNFYRFLSTCVFARRSLWFRASLDSSECFLLSLKIIDVARILKLKLLHESVVGHETLEFLVRERHGPRNDINHCTTSPLAISRHCIARGGPDRIPWETMAAEWVPDHYAAATYMGMYTYIPPLTPPSSPSPPTPC